MKPGPAFIRAEIYEEMLKVPIEKATAGMVLARSIPNPQMPKSSLLKAGYELTLPDIKRLRSLRVFRIWIQYPSLDFLILFPLKLNGPFCELPQALLFSTV